MTRDFGPEGRFAFTSQIGGEHKICLQTNSSKWFGAKAQIVSRKLCFNITRERDCILTLMLARLPLITKELRNKSIFLVPQSGVTLTNPSAIEVQVRRLNDRIRDIRAEQNYQRVRSLVTSF